MLIAAPALRAEDEAGPSALALSIEAGGDPALRTFWEALDTLEGRIALSERIGALENERNSQAALQALEDLLRSADSSFKAWLIAGRREYDTDVKQISAVLAEVAAGLAGSHAMEGDLRRFLRRPEAPHLIYTELVRPYLRPDRMSAAIAWNLAERDDGRLAVPAAFRATARETLDRTLALEPRAVLLQEGLARLSGEIDEREPLRASLKKMLVDRHFTLALLRGGREKEPDDLLAEIERVLPLNEGVRIVPESRRKQVKEGLERHQFTRMVHREQRLTARLAAARIGPDDPLHHSWRQLLDSDLALLLVAPRRRERQPEARKVLLDHSAFGRCVVRRSGGAWILHRHMVRELQEWLERMERTAGKQRPLLERAAELAAGIRDEALRDAAASRAGSFLLVRWALRDAGLRPAVTLQDWTRNHLVKSEKGLALREGSRGEIEAILDRSAGIRPEIEERTKLDPRALEYRSDHVDLFRSSSFYNPRTRAGMYHYHAHFPDHHAARLFGLFGWNATSSKDFDSYKAKLQQRRGWLKRLARTHRKLIVHISGMPEWLSSSRDAGTFEGGRRSNAQAHPPRDQAVWKSLRLDRPNHPGRGSGRQDRRGRGQSVARQAAQGAQEQRPQPRTDPSGEATRFAPRLRFLAPLRPSSLRHSGGEGCLPGRTQEVRL
ncbi:MAG: hypothetical protein ACYSX0_13765 [Planctomycetota bacterium]